MLNPGVGIFPPNSMMRNTHHATSRRIGSGSGDRSTPARQVPSWQNAPAYSGGTLDSAKHDSRIGSGTFAHKRSSAPGSQRSRAASTQSIMAASHPPVTNRTRSARRSARRLASPR
jgi:hypothetical protein